MNSINYNDFKDIYNNYKDINDYINKTALKISKPKRLILIEIIEKIIEEKMPKYKEDPDYLYLINNKLTSLPEYGGQKQVANLAFKINSLAIVLMVIQTLNSEVSLYNTLNLNVLAYLKNEKDGDKIIQLIEAMSKDHNGEIWIADGNNFTLLCEILGNKGKFPEALILNDKWYPKYKENDNFLVKESEILAKKNQIFQALIYARRIFDSKSQLIAFKAIGNELVKHDHSQEKINKTIEFLRLACQKEMNVWEVEKHFQYLIESGVDKNIILNIVDVILQKHNNSFSSIINQERILKIIHNFYENMNE